jgi:hypothetical protein
VTIDGVSATMFYGSKSTMGDTREIWFINAGFLYEVTTYRQLDSWLAPIMQTCQFSPYNARRIASHSWEMQRLLTLIHFANPMPNTHIHFANPAPNRPARIPEPRDCLRQSGSMIYFPRMAPKKTSLKEIGEMLAHVVKHMATKDDIASLSSKQKRPYS